MKHIMEKWQYAANYLGEDYSEYYVLCTYNPTSSIIEVANFIAIQRYLEKQNIPYEIVRFGHFICGFVESILVKDSKSVQAGFEIEKALNHYPIFDENIFEKVYNVFLEIAKQDYGEINSEQEEREIEDYIYEMSAGSYMEDIQKNL